jgi:DNA-binding Lrp family transcriptional regulator
MVSQSMIDTKITDYQPHYIEKIIGGDRERELFNENEMKVVRTLLSYPTSQLSKLAKHSELNVKTVKSILNSLVKRNIIRGFKYTLDKDKLGIHAFRLFLKLHHLTQERETVLMNYLRNAKEIIQANRTVGDWDIEIDIEALDPGKIRHIILQIREEFKDIIERFNLIEFHDSHKKSYLPSYLFKEE